jgi:2-C-methyl-D-erythritol 4-phosphate cytidylyltransferase/2-C-methyl-D-erythritol 2,4-cyclodiphosphate synthase
MKAAAIIPAGGSGSRMGLGVPKQFVALAGKPLLIHTLEAFAGLDSLSDIVLVVPEAHLSHTVSLLAEARLAKVGKVVPGGRTRQDSVKAGFAALSEDIELVMVHDGARPLVSGRLIEKCLAAAAEYGAALAALPVKDTLKQVEGYVVQKTIERSPLWQAQTPQAAKAPLLRKAFALAEEHNFIGTDEASVLEHAAIDVHVVVGEERNIKITRPEDLRLAEALLMNDEKMENRPAAMRIGHGYDAHRLVEGRKLILGGVEIPFEKGLLGHSDADVLVHALCDALLGAMAEGDIGRHFPDNDLQFKGIESLKLLAHVVAMAAKKGYHLGNADVTVVAQRPKLAPHFASMQQKLAEVCRVAPQAINLKGTTTEKMGFTGREEGVAAYAVVLLTKTGAPPTTFSG